MSPCAYPSISPLLARGRDRLETILVVDTLLALLIPYSLGDAIDWKQGRADKCCGNGNSPTR